MVGHIDFPMSSVSLRMAMRPLPLFPASVHSYVIVNVPYGRFALRQSRKKDKRITCAPAYLSIFSRE